jgi:hypothetical protein
MRRLSPLAVVVLFMAYLPMVAVGVLVGVIFGWRVPVGLRRLRCCPQRLRRCTSQQ